MRYVVIAFVEKLSENKTKQKRKWHEIGSTVKKKNKIKIINKNDFWGLEHLTIKNQTLEGPSGHKRHHSTVTEIPPLMNCCTPCQLFQMHIHVFNNGHRPITMTSLSGYPQQIVWKYKCP